MLMELVLICQQSVTSSIIIVGPILYKSPRQWCQLAMEYYYPKHSGDKPAPR